ncbi:TetR/AcrR family transcriptional regulator [Halobellus litoreus]|uniref:TetR/AcrR family transcriptional regulator n=1 Tax=Halobellus litoreus TaxID=755310 RepID=A0ABD6DVD7_9EURY|nr:TetR/AcrR family transcriptional regulator [Halobellus litoreus]
MTDAPTDILHATHRALCEHGYAELTMQDIADETDLSKASIHYHYDCKHDLLVAFLDHLYERFEERIDDPDGETPAERLCTLVDSLMARQSDAPAFQTALLEIKAQSPYDDAFRKRLQRFDDAFTDAVREVVSEGVADGTFREDVDPDVVASFLTTFVNGAQTRHVGVGHPLDESAEAVHGYIGDRLLSDSRANVAVGSSEGVDVGGASE